MKSWEWPIMRCKLPSNTPGSLALLGSLQCKPTSPTIGFTSLGLSDVGQCRALIGVGWAELPERAPKGLCWESICIIPIHNIGSKGGPFGLQTSACH